MHVKYCDVNSPVTCLSISALGTLPSVFLVCIGLWALGNLSHATQNKSLPSFTFVHLIKLVLLVILTVTPPVIMVTYALSSVMILEIVYFLYYGFSATNWIINMYILRKEYKKVGYTSAYLRAFWIIDLFFQSIFLYLIVYELETPINQYKIQNYCRTGSLLLLVLFSCFKVKDSPKAVIEDYTGEYVRVGGVSRRSNLLDRFKISLFGRGSSVHTLNGHKEVSPHEIVIDPIGLSPFKRSQYDDIEEIGISGYEDVLRNDQITTVFKVLYLMNKGLLQTRRSYSEFYRLYIKVRGRYAGEAFPAFPVKLSERESRTERVLIERRKKLEDFLKFICQNKLYIPEFFEFLKEEHELPQFTTNSRPEKDSIQSSSYVSPFLAGNSSGVESRNSNSNSRKGQQSEKSLSFNQPLDESDAKSFLEDSESSQYNQRNV